jgi:BirA family transcriptional regulator, biotin operon repressor / biotin---[acetyl-CoA-carboxylase] ligase
MSTSTFVKTTTEFLHTLDFVKKPFVFDSVDSTNLSAKDLAKEGAEEGTVVLAKVQRQGRGRFERRWESPEGGVYLSIILRPSVPPQKASLLPFVAALAVAKTINSYGVHATIKWPNDVRVKGKKIAGILLESEGEGPKIAYVVVGIGINLSVDLESLPTDLQTRSTSLHHELGHPVESHEFLQIFFMTFEHSYEVFKGQRYTEVIDEWKTHSDTLGKNVRVQTMAGTMQGTAVDIDQSGFLLLRTANGETKKVLSGDCLYFDELNHA